MLQLLLVERYWYELPLGERPIWPPAARHRLPRPSCPPGDVGRLPTHRVQFHDSLIEEMQRLVSPQVLVEVATHNGVAFIFGCYT